MARAADWTDSIAPSATSNVVPFTGISDIQCSSQSGYVYEQLPATGGYIWFMYGNSARAAYSVSARRFYNIGGVVVVCKAWRG